MSTRRRGDERGYTLVEFAVAMSVFLIFMSIATPFMFSQLQGALDTQERVELTQNARSAIRLMTRELRQASSIIDTPPEKPSGPNELSFGVDYDGNGVINAWNNSNAALEEITYYHQGETLYRGRRVGQGVPLATGVTGVEFVMFGSNLAFDADGDGVVTGIPELDTNGNLKVDGAELGNVTRIGITVDVGDSGATAQTYQAQVFLRNRVI
jgi:prepilin-type N-terminal cleavage/methylation domain-containing protein